MQSFNPIILVLKPNNCELCELSLTKKQKLEKDLCNSTKLSRRIENNQVIASRVNFFCIEAAVNKCLIIGGLLFPH